MNKLWIVLLVVCLGAWVYYRQLASQPVNLAQGRLQACPTSPNCVCSLDTDPVHQVEPFPILLAADPLAPIRKLLESEPRTTIIVDEPHYLHAECRTRFLGFVDDLEFSVDANSNLIHVRSASRLGYSDFGVNRRRVEQIRQRYLTSLPH